MVTEHTPLNIGIIGATGHTGEELIDVLLKHPYARITRLYNTSEQPQIISDVFPRFKKRIDLECRKADFKEIKESCDVVFLALPHTVSMQFVPPVLKTGAKVIDLSADYRIKNTAVYAAAYNTRHKDAAHLKEAVYGLPEIYRAKIKEARLIANPGCYPTAGILAAAPLLALSLADEKSLIIDAKSGVTGAGRKMSEGFLFSEVNEDFRAYKVNTHQHAPEINQQLGVFSSGGVSVVFVPHLLPLNRGILATVYARPKAGRKLTDEKLVKLYRNFYNEEPFVRIKDPGSFPRIKDTAGTNFCDIGVRVDKDIIIVIAALDNLLKGAAGQAVQNMNIMHKLPETAGLV